MANCPDNSLRLPLVAIEHYMLAEDRPQYPMVFFIRLTLDGRLEPAAFESAVEAAVRRHPLLQARIEPSRGRRRYWTWPLGCKPAIHWGDAAGEFAPQIDLTSQSGLRMKVEERGRETTLLLGFHHGCCDGLGGLEFVNDLLTAYAAEQGAKQQSSQPDERLNDNGTAVLPDPQSVRRLADRGRFGLRLPGFLLRLPLELLGGLGVIEFYSHRPVPLAGSAEDTERRAWPDQCYHEFSVEQSLGLKTAAKAQGATLNDLLIRDLFLAVGDWIDEREPAQHGRHVRVMVPVNLRTRRDSDLSAANVVAMINLDRRPHRWRNLRRMLRVLHWEMSAVKRARLGLTFIRGIQVVHYVFNKLSWLMPADKCMATCVLSNLGELWRGSPLVADDGRVVAGDVSLRRVEMLPPIRPLTRAGLAVVTYAGRLTIALHYDHLALTAEEGRQLLATYVGRLEASLAPSREQRNTAAGGRPGDEQKAAPSAVS